MKLLSIKTLALLALLATSTIFVSCSDDEDVSIRGCTDPESLNYDASATESDGSCEYLSDKLVGTWEINDFVSDGDDLIQLGYIKGAEISFDDDGEFELSYTIGGNYIEFDGDWELDDDELTLEFNPNDADCWDENDYDIDFSSSYSKMSMDGRCANGKSQSFEMERD